MNSSVNTDPLQASANGDAEDIPEDLYSLLDQATAPRWHQEDEDLLFEPPIVFVEHPLSEEHLTFLLDDHNATVDDYAEHFANSFDREVNEWHKANAALESVASVLESRVRERTHDLEMALAQLQRESQERKLAVENTRQANSKLRSVIYQLEERSRQMFVLVTMGSLLQACRTLEETIPIIVDSTAKMFPGESGSLSFLSAEHGKYMVVAAWGSESEAVGRKFAHDECAGLLAGQIYAHHRAQYAFVCGHVGNPNLEAEAPKICIPLATQDDIHGILHISSTQSSFPSIYTPSEEEREQAINLLAERVSLSIANLKLHESLRQQSIRDTLTGLFNRRHMEASLEREIARAQRAKSCCAIIMLDVDHFKKFNDNYGHQAGDALLKALGAFLRQHVRHEDIPCRYGGEEFIMILPGASEEVAMARAESIRHEIETNLVVPFEEGFLPQITSSVGVACFPWHAPNGEATIKAADAALYESKKNGRNRVTVSTKSCSNTPE